MTSLSPWLALAASLSLGTAAAQDERLVATLNACKAVPEPAARLACYDAALGRRADAPPPEPAPVAAPAPVAPQSRVAAAPAPAGPPAADFGLTRPPIEVQAIESRITGRFEGWGPGTRIELANGQVWEFTDGTRGAYDLASPAVRVKRGVLGSFFVEIEGVAATPRVRRVK